MNATTNPEAQAEVRRVTPMRYRLLVLLTGFLLGAAITLVRAWVEG